MELILISALLFSFVTASLILPSWIRKAQRVGLVWENMNRYDKLATAGSGGIAVITGFILGVFVYIAINTFYIHTSENTTNILALTSSLLILAGVGIIDDLLGWKSGGLSKKFRLLMCVFAAVPLIVINAGNSSLNFPIIGEVELGAIYALIFIPIGITGAATTFNFLAGFNGLEAGQGIIMLSALSIVAYFTGAHWLAFIGICMIAAIIPFYYMNKVPAKVFPGDVFTYPVGGMIAIMAILGNFERIAIFFFIPYILETFLKSRGRLSKHSFGKPNADGTLDMPYEKVYGLEHLAILFLKKVKNKVYERDVVYLIYAFQVLVIVLGMVIFRDNIF